MAYPKAGKKSKLVPLPRPALSELSDNHKEAIFNHEDCRKVFEERIKGVKLDVSEHSKKLIAYFKTILPDLSDTQLNLSDVEGEYSQLIDLVEKSPKSGQYTTHPGIFILMVNLLRKQPGKSYSSGIRNRCECFTACEEVLKSVKALEIPVRDACISEFYASATQDQLDDIRITAKHRENPAAHGMPGNQAVPQFRR